MAGRPTPGAAQACGDGHRLLPMGGAEDLQRLEQPRPEFAAALRVDGCREPPNDAFCWPRSSGRPALELLQSLGAWREALDLHRTRAAAG